MRRNDSAAGQNEPENLLVPDPLPAAAPDQPPAHHHGREVPQYHSWIKALTGTPVKRKGRRLQPEPNLITPSGTMEDLKVIQAQLVQEVSAQRLIWEEFRAAAEKREAEPIRLPPNVWKKVAVAYNGLTYVWNPRLEVLLQPTIFQQILAEADVRYPDSLDADFNWLFEEMVTKLHDLRALMKFIADNELIEKLQ